MRAVEPRVRRAVEAGEVVEYSVVPIYEGTNPIPKEIRIRAVGDKSFDLTETIPNIAFE